MKCIKCGYENNENAKFCNECGKILNEKVEEDNTAIIKNVNECINEKKVKNKTFKIWDKLMLHKTKLVQFSKKKKIIIGIVLIIILFISVISIYVRDNNKIKKMAKTEIEQVMIKEFNPKLEEAIIAQYDTLSDKQKAICDENFKNKIDLLYDYYIDEKIGEPEAIGKMKVIAKANTMSEYEKEIEAKIGKYSYSEDRYKDGEAYYKKGLNGEGIINFHLASVYYGKVDKEYKYYDDAQKKIELATAYFKGNPIQRDKPSIGMTKEEVLNSSWGKSKSINKTTTQYGIHEQWVYSNNRYLYFDDGILTSIQE